MTLMINDSLCMYEWLSGVDCVSMAQTVNDHGYEQLRDSKNGAYSGELPVASVSTRSSCLRVRKWFDGNWISKAVLPHPLPVLLRPPLLAPKWDQSTQTQEAKLPRHLHTKSRSCSTQPSSSQPCSPPGSTSWCQRRPEASGRAREGPEKVS
jgi:hypothetical protein